MYKFLIEDWSIITSINDPFQAPEMGPKRLMGKVYGHYKFEDDTLIVTSAIDVIDEKYIKTIGGSVYSLGKQDTKYKQWLNKDNVKTISPTWLQKIKCFLFGHKYDKDAKDSSYHLCSRCGKNAIELN